MRLEGRSSPTASTAQKSKSFFTVSRRQRPECAIHYICPPDWCHAFGWRRLSLRVRSGSLPL